MGEEETEEEEEEPPSHRQVEVLHRVGKGQVSKERLTPVHMPVAIILSASLVQSARPVAQEIGRFPRGQKSV